MMVQELIEEVRGWQIADKEYQDACQERLLINGGNTYPATRREKYAFEARDRYAEELTEDIHSDKALKTMVALIDEIHRLRDENMQLSKTLGHPFEEDYDSDDDENYVDANWCPDCALPRGVCDCAMSQR